MITSFGFNDDCTFVFVSMAFNSFDWNNIIKLFSFSVDLRCNFNLLASGKKEIDRHSTYPCHLSEIENAL